MSERSHPLTGPKPLTPEVLKGIVGGAQDGDWQKVDGQTAVGMTAGADEASPGAPPGAPGPGNAEGARGAANEAKVAPATPPMMAGEAASQAAGGATTDHQGGGNPVVDQAPDHSQPPAADPEGLKLRMQEVAKSFESEGADLRVLGDDLLKVAVSLLQSDRQSVAPFEEMIPDPDPGKLKQAIHALEPSEFNKHVVSLVDEVLDRAFRPDDDIPMPDIRRVDS